MHNALCGGRDAERAAFENVAGMLREKSGASPANAVSVLSVVERIAELTRQTPRVGFHAWRTGDQRYYVSDTRKFSGLTGWTPRVPVTEGMQRLHTWLRDGAGLVPAAASSTERVAS